MVISLALLGYGASGTFLVFVKQRALARFGVPDRRLSARSPCEIRNAITLSARFCERS
jgi:hypothetical protein